MVAVEYVSGDDSYVVGDEKQIYIFPQNEAGATKEYVDEQDALKLSLTGGTVTGPLDVNAGFAVKTSGSAPHSPIFQVVAFSTTEDSYARYLGKIESDDSLVTKKYLEDYVDEHGGGDAKVPVQAGAPSGITVGSMWFDTTTNSFMIKVS